MDLLEIMKRRHSVREYTNQPIEGWVKEDLIGYIEECNRKSGLHMQLFLEDPDTFSLKKKYYGHFKNVRNYIAIVANDGMEEACGYYGEKVVLKATELGLDTCWVGVTFNRQNCQGRTFGKEKLYMVIAVGYGTTHGKPHTNKPLEEFLEEGMDTKQLPDWFQKGMEAVLLAPSTKNQQAVSFSYRRRMVTAKEEKPFLSKVDLGIAKLHFEIGAGLENFFWI